MPARRAFRNILMKRLSGYPEAVASGVITQQPGEYSAEKLIVPEGKMDLALTVRSVLFPNVMVKAISDSEIPMRRRLLKQFALGILYGLSLVCVGKAASLPGHQPLFPSDCIAILLVGLPGDLESETTFSQQLQGWIDVIANNGKVQKLFVLCDSPELITLPARIDGNVFKANRTNFLALTKRFEGRTNSLRVIAWGHGGKQGSTPVLHVQGPRLTPSDFRAMASEIHGLESRWILMFRGSGRFASELAGESREILSSEHEMMFDSDPIGMTPLLKLARGSPGISFLKLAEALGRDTADWYAERNLAGTEEPTLWEGNGAARLLAPGTGGDSLASRPAENKPEPEKPSAPEQDQLPPVWNEIKRVTGQQFPDSDAIILRRRISYTLGSNPAIGSEEEEFIQVLTAEGKRFGDFDISYTPPFEEIEFLDCEVLRPDGKLVRLDPDAIREERDQSSGDYQPNRRKTFSLPGVIPGAVLHIRHRHEWKKFPMPYVSLEIPIGLELPVLDGRVRVSLPKEAVFHFALEHVAATDPEVKQTSYGVSYSWQFENQAAYRREVLAPPGGIGRLLVSTFPDWASFAEWYWRISKLADELTEEIRGKALELTRDAKSDREKVLALYNYVTGLRYVAVPLGINSVRPHAAAQVLENQFGDCKDKANLFNALLHSMKIEADLVLVPRFSQAHEGIPGLSFNHAISRVTLDNRPLWVDTTDDVCRFGMLPPGDPGRRVLVIDGQTSSLTQLPEADSRDHEFKLHAEVNCAQPAQSLPTRLSAMAFGCPDYELRSAAREAKERNAFGPLLAARFQLIAGSFALEKQSSTSVSALDENFSWQAEGTTIGIVSIVENKCAVQAPFWIP